MSEENYVRNPEMNRKLDEHAKELLASREIYYVIPYNSFICVKRIAENGKKVYSGIARFLNDSTTTISNMHVSDEYLEKNCIRILDVETLDKYAYQYDMSIPKMKYTSGSWTTHGSHEKVDGRDPYLQLMLKSYADPAFEKLEDDPMDLDPFDFWPDMDDRDDYDMDD